ncbi:uncharacterized protein LY79DRAFT_541673 [Colletotrichum navitas]|uniref:Uncharacterized protein n=1 Tax=Colletotrichum navitas TaxID=681940 RepID=A0AAD8Q8U7_9PEZI|nr:uncharacterized protein LY79DRAFT_541673 [Colletotrichum navitas]KAK1597446.1 hypothetical protein LY79DRAFT_541673 [Colletotrichum navitas]
MSYACTQDFTRIWTCTSPGCFLICLFTCSRHSTVFIRISLLSPGLPYWAGSRDRHPPARTSCKASASQISYMLLLRCGRPSGRQVP